MTYQKLVWYLKHIQKTHTQEQKNWLLCMFKYIKLKKINLQQNIKVYILCSSIAESTDNELLFADMFRIPCIGPQKMNTLEHRMSLKIKNPCVIQEFYDTLLSPTK